jgi:DNA polymerase III subunit alpha
MKITKIKHIKSENPIMVADCFVDSGYLQGEGGSLPDVDNDFQSDRRQDVKAYIEQRYNLRGKQRVFSAGTLTTLKVKAAIKDVARTMRIPVSLVNYLTSIFDDDKCDFSGIFKLAFENKKIARFVEEYPMLFEDLRTLMFQPRSSSVHASALLVTPDHLDGEEVECFDFTPIKKVDGILVSEFDGYMLDEQGLLKNDCLATKELSKIKQTIDLCNREYGADLSMEKIATGSLDEPKAYELLCHGFTQNVFQLSSKGMTKFICEMQPSNIHDIIAANALYRPATLENGSTEAYVDSKHGDREPVYLWGTHEALKDTYGLIVYQEQVVNIARKVGNFSLGDGVRLVKFISKKKIDKIQAMKVKFMEGAQQNGCPVEEAEAIWQQIEACGSYLFNKSHATAYAITAYIGAYLKAKYPTAFYTVALQWAEDNELVPLMSEMEACSQAKVVSPDINNSTEVFYTDFSTDSIFWSLVGIKMVGLKAAEWIIEERTKNGNYTDIVNFIERVFKYKLKKYQYWDDPDNEEEAVRCPVTARHVLNLILAGCFDKVENVGSVIERYAIIEKAATQLGFEVKEKDFPADRIDKHYFWSQQQIKVSGIGSIDYRRLFDNCSIRKQIKGRASYADFKRIASKDADGTRVATCATVVSLEERKYKSSKTGNNETFCKIVLQQNNDLCECIVWSEEYAQFKGLLQNATSKIMVLTGQVRYSDYAGTNNISLMKSSKIEIL